MKGCSTSNLVGAVIPNRPCLISKTLQRVLRSLGEGESSARFTETERRRATFSIAVFLALLLAAPCFAWDDSDDFSSGGFKTKSTQNSYGFKSQQSEDTSFATQQRNSLKVDSIQESHEKQNRWNEEFNARSKQMAEEQNKKWDKLQSRQEAENNAWEARQWKDVETVAGAFVASGPYYKAGQRVLSFLPELLTP